MDHKAVNRHVSQLWEQSIVPALAEYITIPAISAHYDADGSGADAMEQAVELARSWCDDHAPDGATVEVVRLEGRSPVLLVDVPASDGTEADPVLLYGHLDKQPPMEGWRSDLGPWKPVLEDGRLYGRGGADDGYAVFGSVAAIEALRAAGGRHSRCFVLIECSEESGSTDLPAYVEHLADRLGTPGLVVCLDSGCGTYDRIWSTVSLRGNITMSVRVDVLKEGLHSGLASGVVPSSFRLLRALLERIEDARTGEVLLSEFHTKIPAHRMTEIAEAAALVGPPSAGMPWSGGTRPTTDDAAAQMAARTWSPTLSVTGVGGMPPMDAAGNVLRPWTEVLLSFRTPPTVDAHAAAAAAAAALEQDPPSGATVRAEVRSAESGWDAQETAPWLAEAVDVASQTVFGNPARVMGEGGTIPFMNMLGQRYPQAQFFITGVLGPRSNAHGPNEFLHLDMAEGVTVAVAHVLDAYAANA